MWKLLNTGNNLFLPFPALSLFLSSWQRRFRPMGWIAGKQNQAEGAIRFAWRNSFYGSLDCIFCSCLTEGHHDWRAGHARQHGEGKSHIDTHIKSLTRNVKVNSANELCLGFSPGQVGGTWIRKMVQPS